MLDDQSWFDLVELVNPSDLYRTQHQIIFEAMMVIENKDQPLDAVTLSEELQNQGQLEKVGGVGYLADIADSTPGATNVLAWARIDRERSILRQLIGAANNIADAAFNPDGRESDLLLELAEQSVFQISENRLNDGGPEKIGPALLQSAVEKVQFLFAKPILFKGLLQNHDFSRIRNLMTKRNGYHPQVFLKYRGHGVGLRWRLFSTS